MAARIDEIDAKIIKILLLESRTSFTDIAYECKITVTAVRMRYKRLWRDGVINGEKMLVNPHCLGYPHIADLGMITSVENEGEIRKFLESKPYIGELIGPLGHYSFWGKVALRDLNKLHDIIEDLESNCNINHVNAFIWAEAINIEFPQNLIIKPLDRKSPQKIVEQPPLINLNQAACEFDEVDKKIALILTQNSRTPFKSIAAELKISSTTVIQRYKKLRETLLTRSTVTINLQKLGYNSLANVFIKVSNRSKMPDIYSQLLQIPNVIVIIRQMGAYDLYCAVPLEDFESLFEVYGKIIRVTGVEIAEVFLTRIPPSWPLNLFPSLIENEYMKPKYWPGN
ncbi:MAG: Lrp/AsnC family transcriptional regulator [Candidatus Bathyarchaeia archaeon]